MSDNADDLTDEIVNLIESSDGHVPSEVIPYIKKLLGRITSESDPNSVARQIKSDVEQTAHTMSKGIMPDTTFNSIIEAIKGRKY